MSAAVQAPAVVTPYRFFDVEVAAVRDLSPHFTRVTFAGPDLAVFGDKGPDQRIKVIVPLTDGGLQHCPRDPDGWYAEWRQLPEHRRNPIRTYTARHVRADRCELDVDVVRHGTGPAATWFAGVRPGDPGLLLGPDARWTEPDGGAEWQPPADLRRVLVAGDETAYPAIANIAALLPAHVTGHILLEVPEAADVLDLPAPSGVAVQWLARGGSAYGVPLLAAVREAVADLSAAPGTADDLPEVDPDVDIVWEVPEHPADGFYAWIAGEAGAVVQARRHLVRDLGVDRGQVAFMGYWRNGKAEG